MDTLRAQPTFTACPEDGLKALFDASSALAGLESQVVFSSGAFPMLRHHRRVDGREFFWLANNTDAWQSGQVSLKGGRGAASIWDCETGTIRPIASADGETGAEVTVVFKPYEAYWLVFDPDRPALGRSCGTKAGGRDRRLDRGALEGQFRSGRSACDGVPDAPPAAFVAGIEKPLEDWSAWGLKCSAGCWITPRRSRSRRPTRASSSTSARSPTSPRSG